MKLVIVESPTKAKTITKFLGKDYTIESSFGHVRDLPKSKLGIDIEKNFEPQYVIPTKARKNVTALKKIAAKSDEIILATDEDREGEAIAWHLVQALDLENPKSKIKNRKIERIVFHEITKSAIEKALENPREIDYNRVHAQQARRVLDRIVGYKLSPFLWKKITSGLSAGRVQSVALRLIVEREEEIKKFIAQEYWTIAALLHKTNDPETIVEATLQKINKKTLDKFAIPNKEEAEKHVYKLKQATYHVESIEKKEVVKHAPPPFITSTLQQDAARRLNLSAKKTMFLAQRLYEQGHITYMRTDSLNLSQESTLRAKEWLHKNLGEKYTLPSPRIFTAKSKLAQEAHEAIRPTVPENTPESISLDTDQMKVYKLIWQRFIASQMPDARVNATSITFNAESNKKNYTLKASGQQIIFDGYLKIWPQKFEAKILPEFSENEIVLIKDIVPSQHFTEPPPRYSEATLIKTLEEYGIGRPSTYAPIISVIQTRNYVEKEQRKFKPTEIGTLVNKVLIENFPEVFDVGFTAQLEDELDEVAHGKTTWQTVVNDFYQPFAKTLTKKYEEVSKDELVAPEVTNEKCDLCGKPMVVKMSRFGKFLGCSGFPECKGIKKLDGSSNKMEPKSTGLKCPKCLASKDPERKNSPGEIVERFVRKGRARGKMFWGCNRYPTCDYASWEDPKAPQKEKTEEKPTA